MFLLRFWNLTERDRQRAFARLLGKEPVAWAEQTVGCCTGGHPDLSVPSLRWWAYA